jgi:hypothetical protein
MVPLLMVLPAWPPLAVPASPALLLIPELLHASPSKPVAKRAAAAVEVFNIGTNMGHVYWEWVS